MEKSDWAQNDYRIAREYIEDHEEQAVQNPVLNCDQGVTVILPLGVPGLGFRLHGLIMLAPLPLFILCAILIPVFGFTGSWKISLTTLSITAGCAILVLGLLRAILLVVGQRETFPRKYFATLGPKGIAMHFSRCQLPLCNPRQELLWKQVESFERTQVFFPPGIFKFKPMLPVIKVQARDGQSVILPAPSNPEFLADLENRLNASQQ